MLLFSVLAINVFQLNFRLQWSALAAISLYKQHLFLLLKYSCVC